ncbi:DUF5680 domain-containing protein [Desulfitobacterium hafniense]|uniref:DUF5680 domain-containing protein n=1 Tax=Desulfitobacterium hafniense TaxID=49338 RepID=UPI00037D7E14|nr:DUF5680 domain-containing protein [Desulfitobacterium hafniense]
MVIVVIKAELMGALIEVLIKGRIECYVKKSSAYNPYSPGQIYDWDFKLSWGDYLFSDSYRGFNPYSGVEYIYYKERSEPIWSCDYVGYALAGAGVSEKEIYGFLKRGRGKHLLEWAGECTGTLFSDYSYQEGDFGYQTRFRSSSQGVLQTEEIYCRGRLAATQLSAGYWREEAAP